MTPTQKWAQRRHEAHDLIDLRERTTASPPTPYAKSFEPKQPIVIVKRQLATSADIDLTDGGPEDSASALDQVQDLLAEIPQRSWWYNTCKRTVDVAIAVILLVVAAPIMAAVALMIRLDSPGPAVFRQTRVGKDLVEFEFLKFRTMYTDAREQFPELYAYRFTPGAERVHRFKTDVDPRLTRAGRIIRRTSLDELPNLLHVLTGEMSLVGPRPEIPEMLPYYRPEEMCKFSVLPGVTGLAQTSGRNLLLWAETNALDVEYVHTRSVQRDLSLLLATVTAVVGMVGAL